MERMPNKIKLIRDKQLEEKRWLERGAVKMRRNSSPLYNVPKASSKQRDAPI